jgi:hypothetical protein
MTTLNAFFHPRVQRIRRYLRRAAEPSVQQTPPGPGSGPAPSTPGHAPGHRHLEPPPDRPEPRRSPVPSRPRHPAWLDSGGRVDRLRRNERHGDEQE